jgi:hypothetical protein
MRSFRFVLMLALLAILGVAVQQTLAWLGVWGNPNESQVKSLDDGDQEIALIEPATSSDDWGRLVTAIQLLERDWPTINPKLPALHVSLDGAFPLLTAEVPEIVFSFANGSGPKLRLRWYKISGEHNAAAWVAKLRERGRPPLAVIGGGTSDRAVRLARRLQDNYPDPELPSPVLLITTATAEKTKRSTPLIEAYPKRSFRYSFTNPKMVASLLSFVEHRLYPAEDKDWAESLWVPRAGDAPPVNPAKIGTMHAVAWEDERYSLDMNDLFETEFKSRYPAAEFSREGTIRHSVGGFFHPSPQEQTTVGLFLALRTPIRPNSFLVLPTQMVRMRRFLINLWQRNPRDARNLVILNGDAISFHSIYRDREVVWNILDLPYSLVFFSHRNPIDQAAGFAWAAPKRAQDDKTPQSTTSGTHDILLYRDIIESFLYAAYDGSTLLGDPLRVRQRLQATCWYHPPGDAKEAYPRVCNSLVHKFDPVPPSFFDAAGDRQSHTGEHIVWLKPDFTGDNVNLTSTISVWSMQPQAVGAWQLVKAHRATYNQEGD